MRIILKIFLLIALVNCSQRHRSNDYRGTAQLTPPDTSLTIQKIHSDSSTMRWVFNTIVLDFSENKANFNFNFSCVYSFETRIENDRIEVFWKHTSDCPYKLLGDMREPKNKSEFASISLNRDSSLTINYADKRWVDQVNLRYDTLFPSKMVFKPYGSW